MSGVRPLCEAKPAATRNDANGHVALVQRHVTLVVHDLSLAYGVAADAHADERIYRSLSRAYTGTTLTAQRADQVRISDTATASSVTG